MSENSELFLYDYNQTMFLGSFTSKTISQIMFFQPPLLKVIV